MTTFNTGNKLGSAAAKDLYDNAENLDYLSNDMENESLPDRFGVDRKTWHGLQQMFIRAMAKMGWVPFGTFEEGATLTEPTQTLKYKTDGNYYRWDGGFDKIVPADSTPDSTGGVANGAWVNVTDLTLRNAMAQIDGFGHIGGATYEQIRAYPGSKTRMYCIGRHCSYDGAYGFFEVDSSDTTSNDDGGTVLVDITGRRWKRQYSGNISVDWFCWGDGVVDDTVGFNAALSLKKSVELNSTSTYKLSSTISINLSVQSVFGTGAVLDFSSIEDGAVAIDFINSPTLTTAPADLLYPSAVRHEVTGCILLGPGKAGSGVAYEMTSIGVKAHSPHGVMKNSLVYGFGVGVDVFTNGYVLAFENVNIGQNARGIYSRSGGSNQGERINFVNCNVYDNALAIDNRCITGVLTLTNCSIDYNLKTISAQDTAVTELIGTWVECNDAGESKTHIDLKNAAILKMIGGRIQQNGTLGALTQDGFLNTESDCVATFTDVFMFNTANVSRVFDTGSGLVKINNTESYPVSYLSPRISNVANNHLADGGFTQSSLFDMWSVFIDSGTITSRTTGTNLTLSITTEQARSGTQCLKFNKLAGGVDGDAVLIVPAEPGSRVAATCWWKKIAQASSGGNVYVSTRAIKFHGLKSNGIPDVGSGITFDTFLIGGTDAETDWQQIESGMDRIIPSWANAFEIYINASAFQGSLYFDDFNVSAM